MMSPAINTVHAVVNPRNDALLLAIAIKRVVSSDNMKVRKKFPVRLPSKRHSMAAPLVGA
jgi:hypothetical protein